MLRIGGYVMSLRDITDWARRRFPGIDIYDEGIIPSIIREHAEEAEGLKLRIVPTMRDGKGICVFVAHSANDPFGTRTCFTPFPRDAFAVELGRKLFLTQRELDQAEYTTICDPFERGY
ncbi:hypothetical protein C0992_010568 [Termitomyces sp. T32_za158]|nr:hypothetical protein C0992_010568 [Termitomyces sp. T32_za158]